MKILFIASYRISPNSGGVQRVTQILSNQFKELGDEVSFLSLTKGECETIFGINQYYLPYGRDLKNKLNKKYFIELLIKLKADIVINQIGFDSNVIKFLIKNKPTKVKVISVHHNCLKCLNDMYPEIYNRTLKKRHLSLFLDNNLGWYILKKIHRFRFGIDIKRTIRGSDRVVLLSQKFKSEIPFYVRNFDSTKILSIPNPNSFEVSELELDGKMNNILYVGRLRITQKRVEKLIVIWSRLCEKYTNWRFDIVGDGMDRTYLEKIVSEKKIKRIFFHGFKDPRPFFKKAKVFVLSSDYEGFGLVLTEAQCYGVVPVAFRSFSSIDEIILNNKTGLIVENFDLQDFIEKLEFLLIEDEKLYSMSKNAYSFVKKFNKVKIAKIWQDVFAELKERNGFG